MDPGLPSAPILYNYDIDRDASPGLLIAKGGSGPDEPLSAKHQDWVTPAFAAAVTIQGDAMVKLWSAMKDFDPTVGGAVTVYLRDCEGWNCIELGFATVARANWQTGSSWSLETFTIPIGDYTLAPGHSLELVVTVDASSGDDMWFAYDTNQHKSRVSVSATALLAAESGAVLPGLVARWIAQPWARWLFS